MTTALIKKKYTNKDRVQRLKAIAHLSKVANATAKIFSDTKKVEASAFKTYCDNNSTQSVKLDKGERNIVKLFQGVFDAIAKEGGLAFDESGIATVVTYIDGKVLDVEIKQVKNAAGEIENDKFEVALIELKLDASGVLIIGKKSCYTPVARMTKGDKVIYTASKDGLEMSQDKNFNFDHQAQAIDDSVDNRKAEKRDEQRVQLITAGTGSGKTGILASSAYACGSGIFVVPKDMLKETAEGTENFSIGKLAIYEPPADLAKFLKENLYVALDHDTFIKHCGNLVGENIFIDEVHQLASSNESEQENLKSFLAANKGEDGGYTLAVTATPSLETYEIFGNQVSDFSLFDARNIGAIRDVKKDHIEDATIKDYALKAFDVSMSNVDAKTSVPVQGIVFFDDENEAGKVNKLFNDPKANSALMDQRVKTVEANIKIDIILQTIRLREEPKATEKDIEDMKDDLQKAFRAGDPKDDIGTAYTKAIQGLEQSKKDDIVEGLKKISKGIPEYYQVAIDYLAKPNTDTVKTLFSKKGYSEISVLLTEASTIEESDNAKELMNKGIIMRAVSTGTPLSTGYSNKNVLSVVAVQTKPIKPGSAAERVQQFGREIRAKDGVGFATSICDPNKVKEKVEKNLSAYDIFDKDLMDKYTEQLKIEKVLQQQLEVLDAYDDSSHLREGAETGRLGGQSWMKEVKLTAPKPNLISCQMKKIEAEKQQPETPKAANLATLEKEKIWL